MRYLFLISFIFLASCATPQNEPQSYYGKVYTPGKVSIEGSGVFASTARVKSSEHRNIARKAAYLRLMETAVVAGYKGVRIYREEIASTIGYKISIRGRLYLHVDGDEGVYPVRNIGRVLQGLPLNEPIVITEAKTNRVKKYREKVKKRQSVKNVVAVKATPKPEILLPEPDVLEPVVETDGVSDDIIEGAPMVIMAPEDITGSIKKLGSNSVVLGSQSKSKQEQALPGVITIPKALSGTPLGIIVPKE